MSVVTLQRATTDLAGFAPRFEQVGMRSFSCLLQPWSRWLQHADRLGLVAPVLIGAVLVTLDILWRCGVIAGNP